MSVEFKLYEGTTMEDLGTVAQVVGAKGKLAFITKNLASTKRVAIVLRNKNGESAVQSCSEPVSNAVRKALQGGKTKKEVLAVIAQLSILEGDTGISFICAPAGELSLESFSIEELIEETVSSYEELVHF